MFLWCCRFFLVGSLGCTVCSVSGVLDGKMYSEDTGGRPLVRCRDLCVFHLGCFW